jgi:hypothetical protein
VKNELQAKTPSARLRGVLFVLFKQLQAGNRAAGKTFEIFYGEQMNRMIDDLKAQLDPA